MKSVELEKEKTSVSLDRVAWSQSIVVRKTLLPEERETS